jgi:putative two-component system response regulator
MPVEQAAKMIQDGSGTHFDPDVVTAFTENLDQFKHILLRFADTDESLDQKLKNMRNQGML